jgi:hypothetical protein
MKITKRPRKEKRAYRLTVRMQKTKRHAINNEEHTDKRRETKTRDRTLGSFNND